MPETSTRLCDRCLKTIHEGRGEFNEVKIAAVADPCPPVIDAVTGPQPHPSPDEWISKMLGDVSPQEAQDQVHRQLTLSLCNSCFSKWIEDPASRP